MAKELTWRRAIDKVLGAAAKPLHYNEITEKIISDGLRTSIGATPAATVNAQISSSIKHDGVSSPYVRVAKGVFALAKPATTTPVPVKDKLTPTVEESDEPEEQYDIVSSFGMFWRRDAIQWVATSKLLGMQRLGATPVDFTISSSESTCCMMIERISTLAARLIVHWGVGYLSIQLIDWPPAGIDSLGLGFYPYQSQVNSGHCLQHTMRQR